MATVAIAAAVATFLAVMWILMASPVAPVWKMVAHALTEPIVALVSSAVAIALGLYALWYLSMYFPL